MFEVLLIRLFGRFEKYGFKVLLGFPAIAQISPVNAGRWGGGGGGECYQVTKGRIRWYRRYCSGP